jgi:hypothetical protein
MGRIEHALIGSGSCTHIGSGNQLTNSHVIPNANVLREASVRFGVHSEHEHLCEPEASRCGCLRELGELFDEADWALFNVPETPAPGCFVGVDVFDLDPQEGEWIFCFHVSARLLHRLYHMGEFDTYW